MAMSVHLTPFCRTCIRHQRNHGTVTAYHTSAGVLWQSAMSARSGGPYEKSTLPYFDGHLKSACHIARIPRAHIGCGYGVDAR